MGTENSQLSLGTPTRRGLLSAIPAIAVALAVTGTAAQARPVPESSVPKRADVPECLADLGIV
jgi:predicted acyltransferase